MNRNQRRKRTQEPAQQFQSRLATLRQMVAQSPAAAGDQAIKLLEEYLEALANQQGYRGEASLGRSTVFLRGRDALPDSLLDQAESYTQVRNALAHTYGLQVSPALASELIAFLEQLLKLEAVTVSDLMSAGVAAVRAEQPLAEARDLMVRGGYGRLPVLGERGEIRGLLVERDVVVALTRAEQNGGIARMTVADALPPDALDRVVCLRPDASRELVAEALREPNVVACLITPSGSLAQSPIGIITHADLLYRM
ncbi:MAG: CBS domain-containing protein [Roseiflexaceae bacterium]|nr:CBS domain-containing protein [Roseiflexaceae bacterium]